jgi:hypothetical protein
METTLTPRLPNPSRGRTQGRVHWRVRRVITKFGMSGFDPSWPPQHLLPL